MHRDPVRDDAVLRQGLPELGQGLLQDVPRPMKLRVDLERQTPALEHRLDADGAEVRGLEIEGDLVPSLPPDQADPADDLFHDGAWR